MLELGAVGSPVDVATFVLVAAIGLRWRRRLRTIGAALVALAHGNPRVDHERLASDLEVDDRDVDAVQITRTDGGLDDE